MPKAVATLSVSQIEALEKAEAQRWNREGRLAAWLVAWLPAFVAHGVYAGVAPLFSESAQLPDLPKWTELVEGIPDYMREPE